MVPLNIRGMQVEIITCCHLMHLRFGIAGRKQCVGKEVEKLSFLTVASGNAQWHTEAPFDTDFLLLNIHSKNSKYRPC